MKLRIQIYGRNSHQLRSGVFDTEFIGDITPYLLHNDQMGAKITTKVGEEWLTTMSVDEYCLETGICDTAQICDIAENRNLDKIS